MQTLPTWYYNDLQQVGVDFEDPADDFETHVREEYSTFAWIIEGMLNRVRLEFESNYLSPTMAEYICRKR
ncbi:hypothetical protein [Chroococcidiopsis sp.]|uniref:hypothetical protein n=1 Tax=Chroococcidiopsis sp. TaxID=3088168 RepID=UPI003F2EC8FE